MAGPPRHGGMSFYLLRVVKAEKPLSDDSLRNKGGPLHQHRAADRCRVLEDAFARLALVVQDRGWDQRFQAAYADRYDSLRRSVIDRLAVVEVKGDLVINCPVIQLNPLDIF